MTFYGGRLFESIVDTVLPNGGYVMVLYHAYIDESGTHAGSPIVAVGGYLIKKSAAKKMDREWKLALTAYDLPYFHMVDCAHGAPPFDKLSADQRIAISKRLIGLIKEHTSLGLVAITDPRRFSGRPEVTDPYCFCLTACSMGLASWLSDKVPSRIAYFFEAGHKDGALADREIISWMHDESSKKYYAAHAFARKTDVRLLQAADLLVWQAAKFMKDKIANTRPPRGDFLSLMEHPHVFSYVVLQGNKFGLSVDNDPHLANDLRDTYLMAVFSDAADQEHVVRGFHDMFVTELDER